MEHSLIAAGLTKQQAQAYLHLIDNFPVSAQQFASALGLSRTNAYKLADKLVSMGLASKTQKQKKIAYLPTDPIALSSLVAEARTKMIALERATKEAMRIIKNRIGQDEQAEAKIYRGRQAIIDLFKEQAAQDTPMYFVHSPADLPVMGFSAMHQLRNLTGPSKTTRYGLTPDITGAVKDPKIDEQSRLLRTWIPRHAYASPVEWSACGDELRLFIYADEPYAIKISDRHAADAFRQIWHLLDDTLRSSPEYKKLPRYANRTIWSR